MSREQNEKDLLLALLNSQGEQIDMLWDKFEAVHREIERVDKELKLWDGRWEEGSCEDGGKAPKTG